MKNILNKILDKMVLRLYLVNRSNGKCTGKKRDYASVDNFKKYGIETYERYNRQFSFKDEPTNLKAKLTFLNSKNKWEEVGPELLKHLLNKDI